MRIAHKKAPDRSQALTKITSYIISHKEVIVNILSEDFENGIRSVVQNQFKESFKELLEHETVEKRWLSIESAANYSDCSTNTIRKWLKMGLNLYKIDGIKRIDKNELDEFIQANLVI